MTEKEPDAFEPRTPDSGEDEGAAVEEARLEATRQVFAEVKEITTHPLVDEHVPEIKQRLEYLQQKGMYILAPPKPSTTNSPEAKWEMISEISWAGAEPDLKPPFHFYPLFPDDAKLGREAAYYVQQVNLVSYGQESHVIVMNMKTPETPRLLACAFLHELGHAQKAEQEGRAGQKNTRSIEERLQEEIEMWSVESKLILAIGGQNYQAAVDQFIREVKKGWDRRRPPQYTGKGVALDSCVGRAASAEVVGHRDESFNQYCHFLAAEKYFTARNARAYKLQMLQARLTGQYDKQKAALDLL